MATIATHNGSTVHQAHNLRDKRCVEKEPHINPRGEHETWKHENVKDAYHRIFDKYVQEYNDKQNRDDRKIDDYFKKIDNDCKKHTCYEMIVGIYGNNDKQTEKDIMREYVATWDTRNPNLELIGAYYHADEEGQHHVHIDYIPIVRDCTRGMEVQTGLNGALREQGFVTTGTSRTAQIQWERSENQYLERLCRERNIEIEHPQSREVTHERFEHLSTLEYKVEQKEKELQERAYDVREKSKEFDEIAKYINDRQDMVERTYDYLERVDNYCYEHGISTYQYYSSEFWADRGQGEHQYPEIYNYERTEQEREQIAHDLQYNRDVLERDHDHDHDR